MFGIEADWEEAHALGLVLQIKEAFVAPVFSHATVQAA